MVPRDILDSIELSHEFFVSFGVPGLFAVAFLGFFLLPVPPDLVLIPLAAGANRAGIKASMTNSVARRAAVSRAAGKVASVAAHRLGYVVASTPPSPNSATSRDSSRAIRASKVAANSISSAVDSSDRAVASSPSVGNRASKVIHKV